MLVDHRLLAGVLGSVDLILRPGERGVAGKHGQRAQHPAALRLCGILFMAFLPKLSTRHIDQHCNMAAAVDTVSCSAP